jgi:hypothetical protein
MPIRLCKVSNKATCINGARSIIGGRYQNDMAMKRYGRKG